MIDAKSEEYVHRSTKDSDLFWCTLYRYCSVNVCRLDILQNVDKLDCELNVDKCLEGRKSYIGVKSEENDRSKMECNFDEPVLAWKNGR